MSAASQSRSDRIQGVAIRVLRSILCAVLVLVPLLTQPLVAGPENCNVFADQDAYIVQNDPGGAYGQGEQLFARNESSDQFRPLLHYDLSPISAGSTIESVTAWFWVLDGDSAGPAELHRVTSPWTEGSATWQSVRDAFDPAVSALLDASTEGWHSADLSALAQDWVDGTFPNYGVMLFAAGNAQSEYASSENSTVSWRPCLEVTSTPSGGTSISGTVYEDPDANGDVGDGVGRSGVTVRFHRDDGDDSPDGADLYAGMATTDGGGAYTLGGLTAGVYWVTVDSRTISPLSLTGPQGETWAEQTYGIAGAICAGSSGGTFARSSPGSCAGGRDYEASDDATDLDTSEHVTRVLASFSPVVGVDFGFTFTGVFNTRDGDDAVVTARTVQGSLRQWILNANAIGGSQTSWFRLPTGSGDYTGSAWRFRPASAYPAITDPADLDGRTQSGFSGDPRIEIDGGSAGSGANGLLVQAGNTRVRSLSIHSFDAAGIVLDGAGTNTVTGNRIGTDPGATLDRRNRSHGILVVDSADNVIGGVSAGEANTIAHNDGSGIAISGATGVRNEIRRNSIYDNDLLGIDLGDDGVTGNDGDDSDSGPNLYQNFPMLSEAKTSGGQTRIRGSFTSTPDTSFTLELFSSPAVDPSDHGEGRTYLGSVALGAGPSGTALIDTILPLAITPGSSISATATDPDGNTSEFGQATEVTIPVGDLEVTKDDGVSDYVPGLPVVYTVVVTNRGPDDLSGVSVSDPVASLPQVSSASWTCTPAGGATCTASGSGDLSDTVTLPLDGTVTYTISADLDSAATGDLVNTVTVTPPSGASDPDAGNNSATDIDRPTIDLSLTKVVDEPLPVSGTEVTFTLTASNASGLAPATGVVVNDGLPDGYVYTGDDSASTGTTYDIGSGDWTVGTVPSGGSVALEIRALVNQTGDHDNEAEVIAANEPDVDSVPGNGVGQGEDDEAAATATPEVTLPACNVAASMDTWLSESSPDANDGLHRDVHVLNKSTGSEYAALAFDLSSIPAGSVVTSATLWLYVKANDDVASVNVHRITSPWTENGANWSNLASELDPAVRGSFTPIVQNVYVNPDITSLVQEWVDGTHANHGLMLQATSDDQQSKYESRETNLPAERPCLEVQFLPGGPFGDLEVTKDDGVSDYVPGLPVVYTVVVTNKGPDDLSGVAVSDPVASLPQVSSASWTCTPAGGATCTASGSGDLSDTVTLPLDGTVTYTITADLDSAATGDLVNTATATVASGSRDPDTGNNSPTDTDTATPVVDLWVTVDDGVAGYIAGEVLEYTIVVGNDGPSDAVGAIVQNALLGLPQVASVSWTCVGAGGASCTAGPAVGDINDTVNVPVGGTLTYTVTVTLDPGADGDLVNTVTVAPPGGASDPVAANDSAIDTDPLMIDLSLTNVVDDPLPVRGAEVTFSVTVSNVSGAATATGVVVNADLGNSYLYTGDDSAVSGTIYDSASGDWTVGTVAAGASVVLQLRGLAVDSGVQPLDAELVAANEPDVDSVPGNGVGQGEDDEASVSVTHGGSLPACSVAAVQDTWIDENDPIANNGAGVELHARQRAGRDERGVLQFDLSSIPGGSIITSATLWLSVSGREDSGFPINIHRVTDPWVENTANWTNLANGFDPAVRGSFFPLIQNVYVESDITALTQEWVSGTHANNGLMLLSTSNSERSKYRSRETLDPNERPCLEVQWVPGAATADVQITKDDGTATYSPGGSLTYTIVVSNNGPNSVTGATVSDAVVALPQVTGASWTCVAAGGASCAAGPVVGDINDTVDLPVGATATYTLNVTIDAAPTGDLVNTATVSGPAGVFDPTPANNTATDTDVLGDRSISGTVYEDVDGDADLSDAVGRPQFSITAFRDGGDGQADGSDDTPIATVITDANGDYSFSGLAPGTYWIRGNSTDLPTILSIRGGFSRDYLWPEQTFGAEGALCDDGAGGTAARATAGPCYGGRRGAFSDGPTTLGSSEHVIRVDLAGSDVADVDFGFSFAAVVHTRDGDDDLTKQRTVQGSLRQFILNANALLGPDRMRFVPTAPPNAAGPSGGWWEITLAMPLPAVTAGQVTLDGTAHDLADGSTVLDPNAAVNEQTTGPELVIDAGVGGPGLHLSDASAVVQSLGLRAATGAFDAGSGILVTGASAVGSVIDRCSIWDNDNSGIRIQSSAAGVQVNGSVVQGNGRADARAHGIEMDGAAGCVLDANEILDNEGSGVFLHTNANNGNTITNNTVKRNGAGGFSPAGIAVLAGSGNMIRDNTVTLNAGDGIVVAAGTGNSLVRNGIFDNGELGVDLGVGASGDGVTLNDAGDADAGPNLQINYPVLESAEITGGNLVVRGWARPGTILQFFVADADPSGFGEGASFAFSAGEGSGGDSDNGVGSYGPGPINGRPQGQDTTNRFEFIVATPPGVLTGVDLTASATDSSGNTSEFSGLVAVTGSSVEVSGLVFEDADFSLDASDWDGGAGDRAVPDVDVELYDATDTHIASNTTDGSGRYRFSGLADGNYKVRVRSATLGDAGSPPAGGLEASVPGTWPSPLPEMTWAYGAPLLGGRDAAADDTVTGNDAGPGDTWVAVNVSGVGVTDVNFGFAYNLIVNTADAPAADATRNAQGSLRQFLKNANAIGIAGGTTANASVFRVPASDAGFAAGIYTFSPTSPLPVLDAPVTLDATTQTGFSVSPIVELSGAAAGAGARGLQLLGGSSSIRGLIVNRFQGTGIWIESAGGNRVAGNYIGLAADGMTPSANESGVWVGSPANTIGGRTAAERNVISANATDGIRLDAGSDGTVVEGNYIGVAADGTTPRGNGESGVEISGGADGCTVGGTANGAANVISANGRAGVTVLDSGTRNHRVQRNSIYENGEIGIDLGEDGVTSNDGGAVAAGPNGLLDHPDLSSATVGGGSTTIAGTYGGSSFQTYTLEFYSSAAADPSDFGEGQTYIGTDTVSTGFSGSGSFSTVLPLSLPAGSVVTAIALDSSGNTSEFSRFEPVVVTAGVSGAVWEDVNGDSDLGDAVRSPGVTVRVYLDDGDDVPDGGDSLVGEQDTDASGSYTIPGVSAGNVYWVVVDASDVTPASGGSGLAEQTYGVAGALCTDGGGPETTVTRPDPGPCYAGRRGNVADDFDISGNAEHVTRIAPSGPDINGIDFGLSFNVVTRAAGNRQQGTLRRFVENANGISGPNVMRFVPAVPVNAAGAGGDWWEIGLSSSLPTLTDAATTLDGGAWDLNAPSSRRDACVPVAEQTTGPELVIDADAGGPGLHVEGNDTILTRLGVRNADGNELSGAGFAFDGAGSSDSVVRECTLWSNSDSGVRLDTAGPGIQVSDNVIRGNGISVGDGIYVRGTSAATITDNVIVDSAGYGIDVRDATSTGNTITGNTILRNGQSLTGPQTAGIAIRDDANQNLIQGNRIAQNVGDGIVIESGSQNRVSQNEIFDNGDLGIDLGPTTSGDGVTLNDPGDADAGPNTRLNYPVLDTAAIAGANLVLTGWAGPGALIELFVADTEPSGFGEGQSFVLALTEGSGADADATTGSYGPGDVNGLTQGQDDTDRFRFTVPLPPGVGSGSRLVATATDGNGSTSEFSGWVTVQGSTTADLSLAKSVDVAVPNVGANVVFRLTVTNAGPGAASGVQVTDLLPSGYTYVSHAGAGTYDDVTGLWDVGLVSNGANVVLDITASVNATGSYVNVTEISAAAEVDPDSTPGNGAPGEDDYATRGTAPVPSADLSLTKTADDPTPIVGGSVVFTLTVANAGPTNASGVEVTDLLPSGFTYVGDTGGGSYDEITGVWSAGSINAGLDRSIDITVTVNPNGSYTNIAEVTASNLGDADSVPGNGVPTEDDHAEASVAPIRQADLSLTKTVDVATPDVGSGVVFTITVDNAGPSDATAVQVTDLLPTGYTFVGALASSGAYDDGSGVWSVGAIPGGGSETLNLAATVNPTGVYQNVAEVSASAEADPDSTPANGAPAEDDRAERATTPVPVADLSLTKAVDDATPDVGDTVTFTITVSNAGPSDATGVEVTDALPAGYTFASAIASNGAYDDGTGVWMVGALASGANATLDLAATVNPAGSYANVAEVTASVEVDRDSTPANGAPAEDDRAEQSTAPDPVADLSLTDTIDDPTPDVGSNVVFTWTLSNAGPSDATGVQVGGPVPSGYVYVGQSGDGTYDDVSGVWDAGTVAATDSLAIDLTMTVAPTGSYTNTAEIIAAGASDPDSTPDNGAPAEDDYAEATSNPVPVADLQITNDDGVGSYTPGGSVTYTIVVTNEGPSNVTGATVGNPITSSPQVSSASWTCVAANGATCAAGPVAGDLADTVNLPLGGTATYTLDVTLDPGASGNLVSTATVSAPGGVTDPDASNDTATDTDTEGAASADLQITNDDGVGSYTPGGSVTYTIVVTNEGPSNVTGATVGNPITSSPQVSSASWTCVAANGATCAAGPVAGDLVDTVDVPVGGTATYTLDVTLDPGASGNLVSTATVSAPGGVTDPDASNDTASDTDTEGAASADLQITNDDGVGSYTPGGSVTYTIVVANEGPSNVTGATVGNPITSLPQVSSASWTCVAANGATCAAGPVAGDLVDTVDVPVGGTATYTLDVILDPGASGNLVSTATVSAPGGVTDPDASNDTASDTDTEGAASADLQITNDDGVGSYTPGGSVTYTIVVANEGPSNVTGATVGNPITSLPQVSSASWTCVAANGATCAAGPVAGDLVDTVDVPVGGTATYTLDVTLDPGASGNLVSTATVSAPGGVTDPDASNNTASDTDTEGAASADLQITNDDGVGSYTPGGSVIYTIVVANEGPSNVTGATVGNPITSSPQVSSASWTCVAANGATCAAGPVAGDLVDTVDVPVGGTATYTLDVILDPGASGNLVSTATVSAPGGVTDPTPTNNTASDTDTEGAASADLQITNDDGVGSYTPGGSVTYTIVVTNEGPSNVTGATVGNPIASLPQVASASWTCVAAGGAACTGGPVAGSLADTVDVPVGGTATYTLDVTLDPGATGNLVSTATIGTPVGVADPIPANNTATDTDTEGAASADLQITNDDGVGSYTPGGAMTYTIVVTNEGPSNAIGATVDNPITSLPQVASASWTCVAADGASCTAGPIAGDLVDTLDLPLGGTATYTLDVTLDPGASGDLVSTATVTAPGGMTDPDGANNAAVDTDIEGAATADLVITNDDGVGSYTPGGSVSYTIVVSNAGPSNVVGAAVSNSITSLPQVANASWTCAAAGGATCAAGPVAGDLSDTVDVPVGGTATYTLDVTLDPGATGNLVSTASIAAPGGVIDATPANNVTIDTDTEGAASTDLQVTIDDGVGSYTPGGSLTYTIVVSNSGPSNVIGATVGNPIASLPQVASASWTCVAAGGAACTGGPVAGSLADTVDVPVGGTATYTLDVTLDPGATGNLVSTATIGTPVGVADPIPANNTATDTDTEGAASADLQITNDDGVGSYTPGGAMTYTIVVTNEGPSNAIGATVDNPITSLPQVASASWTCVAADGASCTAGPIAGDLVDTLDLPLGGTATYTLDVTLDPGASGDLVSTATVTAPGGMTDPDGANNAAVDTDIEGAATADLVITNDDGVGSYTPGGSVSYTIVVSNAGPSNVVGAAVSNSITSLPQVANASWTCAAAGGATCAAGPVAGDLSDTVDVPVGGTATYTLDVTLDPGATGNLVSTATVSEPVGVTDPQPDNNTVIDTDTRASSSADLRILLDDGVSTYTPGGSLSYTITVSNAGPSDITGASVNDAVTALPQVSTASWTCTAAAGAVCTAGPVAGDVSDTIDVPVGGTAIYTVDVTLDPGASGDLVNTATVAVPGGASDPTPANNSASDTDTQGSSSADLRITLDDGVATYTPGGSLRYTVVVSNAGPSNAAGATVAVPITSQPQVTAASWTCVSAGGATCTAGLVTGGIADTVVVPVGGTLTYSLDVSIDSAATGAIAAMATVNPPGGLTDPVPGNNTAGDTNTSTGPLADLSLTMAVDNPTPDVGSNVTFSLTVSNAGPSAASSVEVTNALPGGFTHVSHGGPGSYSPTTGAWSVGAIPSGGTATLTLTAQVTRAGGYTNTAEITAAAVSDPDSTPGNGNGRGEDDEAVQSVAPDAGTPVNLVKAAGKREVVMGQAVPYTVVIENTLDLPIDDLRVEDHPPLGFRYIDGSARLDGQPIADPTGARPLAFAIGTLAAPADLNGNGRLDSGEPGRVVLTYMMSVGSGARPGSNTNRAIARDNCCTVSAESTATVEMLLDESLDLGMVIGKLYHDADGDGRQGPNEKGLAGAMVALDDGTYALTDPHGRFHLPAVRPGQRLIKVNRHSLPPGARIGNSPRVLWLTPGLTLRANFGVSFESDEESIGRPETLGVAVSADDEARPVEIQGNAETMSVFVNGRQALLEKADVRLAMNSLDDTVGMTGARLDEPIRFDLGVERPEDIDGWRLVVSDSAGRVVRRFDGNDHFPRVIVWDGRNDDGEMIRGGEVYQYRVETSWSDGSSSTSPRRLFGVNLTSAISMELTGEAFATGSDALSERAREVLAEAAEVLRRYPDERIVIEGHTDDVGTEKDNEELSRRRATSALDYLVSVERLPADRFVVRAHGEQQPIATNDLEEGRLLNRRVEIKGEFKKVDRSSVVNVPRTPPRVSVNREPVELGSLNEFRHSVPAAEETELEIQASDSLGRSARRMVALPGLEITAPAGDFVVPLGAAAAGCTAPADPGEGELVCRVRGSTDSGNRVEVQGQPVTVDPDGRFAFDLAVPPGGARADVLTYNPQGFTRVTSLEVVVSDRDADGSRVIVERGVPELTVQLPPAGVQLSSATLPLTGATAPGNRITVNGEAVPLAEDGRFATTVELPAGESDLEVQVTDPEGRTGAIRRSVRVARNQVFMMAFADGKIGSLEGDGAIESAGLDNDGDLYTDGRVAFYLKGRVLGDYLITAAFDSGKEKAEHLFENLDVATNEQLLRNIDPDRYYTVYGDSSTTVFDAQSDGKLYLALESEEIHALVGNFPLALTDTELAAYQRTAYGARFSYVSASKTRFGDPDTKVIVFGNEVRTSHVHDLLRGTGGSLYYLSHPDVIEGSERVTLVVRDKNTGLPLSSQVQVQNVDYRIKYPEGRVVFNRPVQITVEGGSLVERDVLGGNPVFVQVDYEVRSAGFDEAGYGGRVRRQIGDRVAIGGSYVEDKLSSGEYSLQGLDAEVRLARGSRLIAEVARSTGTDSLVYVSDDGGLSYGSQSLAGEIEGTAWKVAADLDVGEWFGSPEKYRVRAYARELEPGFVSNGNFLDQGTRKTGINATLAVSPKDSVRARVDREERLGDLVPGAVGQVQTTSLQWQRDEKKWGVAAEYFSTEREGAATDPTQTFAAARGWWKPNEKLSTHLDHQHTLDGRAQDRTTAGVSYRVLPWLALETDGTMASEGASASGGAVFQWGENEIYLKHRMAELEPGSRRSTVIGARSSLGPTTKGYAEYQWEDAAGGSRVTSVVGVQRHWDLAPGLRIATSLEGANIRSDGTVAKRTAIYTSVAWSRNRWKAITRNSVRFDERERDLRQLVSFTQVGYEFNQDLSGLAKYHYSVSEDRGNGLVEAQLEERTLGLAYRPVGNDRLDALVRYSWLLDRRPVLDAGDGEHLWEVFSIDTTYRVHRRIDWLSKLLTRKLAERGALPYEHSERHHLVIQRLNVDVYKRLGMGVEYRMLAATENEDLNRGLLLESGWRVHQNFRVGAGYNFTDFTDDRYPQNDYSVRGWFLRVQGVY